MYLRRRVDDLRFQLPHLVSMYTGNIDATAFGPACPQQDIAINFTFPSALILPPALELFISGIFTPLNFTSEDWE